MQEKGHKTCSPNKLHMRNKHLFVSAGHVFLFPTDKQKPQFRHVRMKKVFIAWNTNTNTNKGAQIQEIPKTSVSQSLCAQQAVRAGAGLNVRFGGDAGAKGIIYLLLTTEVGTQLRSGSAWQW